jgi:hypothetical protein
MREALVLCDELLRHLYTVGPKGERWALHPDSPPPVKVLEAVVTALAVPPAPSNNS